MSKLAFIGGTGVYDPGILTDLHSEITELIADSPDSVCDREPFFFGFVHEFFSEFMRRAGPQFYEIPMVRAPSTSGRRE